MTEGAAMVTVCRECGQQLRVHLSQADRARCPRCKWPIGAEVRRQAARNAAIVLEVAAMLDLRLKAGTMTQAEELIAHVFAAHEHEGRT